jgi:hypothetical protein
MRQDIVNLSIGIRSDLRQALPSNDTPDNIAQTKPERRAAEAFSGARSFIVDPLDLIC